MESQDRHNLQDKLRRVQSQLTDAQQRLDYCLGVLKRHAVALDLKHPAEIERLLQKGGE